MIDQDLVVSWTPAIETACVKERQKTVIPSPRRKPRELIVACLRRHPGTLREIQACTGLPLQTVNAALYYLAKDGDIVQTGRLVAMGRPAVWAVRPRR